MPSWTIHLAIVNKVLKEVKLQNSNIFALANVIPDIFEGHNTPNPSRIVKDYSTHYPYRTSINGMTIDLPDIKKFKNEYQKKFTNPVILGYYTHLLTDNYWNVQLYQNHYKMCNEQKNLLEIKLSDGSSKICSFAEIQPVKHKDLRTFATYLNNKYEIHFPEYDEKIFDYLSDLKEFTYTKDDIKRTVEYINENIKNKRGIVQDENYQLYSKEELLSYIDNSVRLIKEEILESNGI